MKKKLLQFTLIIILMLIGITAAHAYTIDSDFRPFNEPFDVTEELDNPQLGASGTTVIILQILAGSLLFFAAPIATIMIVLSSFRMIVGGAESDQYGQAKKGLVWAVAGLVIIILSYSAVRAVITFIVRAAESTGPIGTS